MVMERGIVRLGGFVVRVVAVRTNLSPRYNPGSSLIYSAQHFLYSTDSGIRNKGHSYSRDWHKAQQRCLSMYSNADAGLDESEKECAPGPLVSATWLKNNLSNVKVLDATWYLPNQGKNGLDLFCTRDRIQGAQFFDLDGIADKTRDLPHMLPSEKQFAAAADALGISVNDSIVIYDRQGIFSAPRAWWTWKMLGHRGCVSVLDGGLDAWVDSCGEIECEELDKNDVLKPTKACEEATDETLTQYPAKLQSGYVRSLEQVLSRVVEEGKEIVVDARPASRFEGVAEEPRPGLRKGRIPNSKNIVWNHVLTEGAKKMKSAEEIHGVFKRVGLDPANTNFDTVVASCGSGTTACILVLASELLLSKQGAMSVYDGSWSEWGSEMQPVPVEN